MKLKVLGFYGLGSQFRDSGFSGLALRLWALGLLVACHPWKGFYTRHPLLVHGCKVKGL